MPRRYTLGGYFVRKILVIFLIGISTLLQACSIDAKLKSLNKASTGVVIVANTAKTTGLVSGSQQTGTATGGYVVQSSLGSYISGMKTSTGGGYTVYSSIQGSLVE
jgi:hypothetical protein